MRFFDLHCDTLYRSITENQGLYKNSFHVSIDRTKAYKPYIGCFAIWIPDNIRGAEAISLLKNAVKKLTDEERAYGDYFQVCKFSEDIKQYEFGSFSKQGIILTVEGGAVLAGDINRVKLLKDMGVKIITLTWNGECELGDGAGVSNAKGLSEFGYSVVKKMEKHGIIVDVSHASEKLFYDVANISEKPFIATHSNSKSLCAHPRNLTDDQFKIIRDSKGIVGITFCRDFLTRNKVAKFDDIRNHIEHFLALNGQDTIAFGSDFDGADIPDDMQGIESVENLYEYFLVKNYNENLLDKIFFKNAYDFISKYT